MVVHLEDKKRVYEVLDLSNFKFDFKTDDNEENKYFLTRKIQHFENVLRDQKNEFANRWLQNYKELISAKYNSF